MALLHGRRDSLERLTLCAADLMDHDPDMPLIFDLAPLAQVLPGFPAHACVQPAATPHMHSAQWHSNLCTVVLNLSWPHQEPTYGFPLPISNAADVPLFMGKVMQCCHMQLSLDT